MWTPTKDAHHISGASCSLPALLPLPGGLIWGSGHGGKVYLCVHYALPGESVWWSCVLLQLLPPSTSGWGQYGYWVGGEIR
jgi:hypothetical protein